MSAETILKFSKKLDKIIAGERPEDDAMDVLKILKSTPVTLEVLQKTRIGMTVNDLRKRVQNKEVQTEAKNLIKVWKKLLDKSQKEKDKSSGLPHSESLGSNMSDSNSNDIPDSAMAVDNESVSPTNLNNKINTSVNASQKSSKASLYDDVRTKSRDLILKSLTCCEPPPDSLDAEQLASDIEQAIFNQFSSSTNEKYRASIRSRVFNLRDKKNPDLRENVLLGVLNPEKLATMTAEEMASQEMREMRKKLTKQAINDHQVSHETGTPTDMFKCGKCGKKNCSYNQVQTRSADEPMTTFVFCRECGNRWKFC